MTDKYEKFKEWFCDTGFRVYQSDFMKYEKGSLNIDFTAVDMDELFKEFERYYDGTEREIKQKIAELVYENVDGVKKNGMNIKVSKIYDGLKEMGAFK